MRARLTNGHVPRNPQGVVVVAHGGAGRGSSMAVSPTQLSVLRMVPVANRIARVGRGRLAVVRLLNSSRGWDAQHTPVDDLRWALGQVRQRFGSDLPAALVGHSLGGRAALLAADDPQVTSVVALAAWLRPDDPLQATAGRRVLFVHGDHDRVAPIGAVRAAVSRIGATADVGLVTVRDGRHAMLRRRRHFDGTAAHWVAATLLGDAVGGTVGEVVAGARSVQV